MPAGVQEGEDSKGLERLAIFPKRCILAGSSGHVDGEWSVGCPSKIATIDVEENAVAGAEDDDLALGRRDFMYLISARSKHLRPRRGTHIGLTACQKAVDQREGMEGRRARREGT